MSVSGRYAAPRTRVPERADLRAEVTAQRTANAAADGRPNPSVSSDSGMGRLGRNTGTTVTTATGAINRAAWEHPEQIVGRLTQNPADAQGLAAANAGQRCGPANLLAASIMNGPAAAAATLHGAANSPALSRDERRTLHEIATQVGARNTTFEQLSQAQALMYRAGNAERPAEEATELALGRIRTRTMGAGPDAAFARVAQRNLASVQAQLQSGAELSDEGRLMAQSLLTNNGQPGRLTRVPDPQNSARHNWVLANDDRAESSGLNDREMADLSTSAAGWSRTRRLPDVSVESPLATLLARREGSTEGLSDGQAATMRVAGDTRENNPNHFITVGRQPDGTPYIYNPDPAPGDSVLVTGEDALREARRYDGANHRIRSDNSDSDFPNVVITHPGAHGEPTRRRVD